MKRYTVTFPEDISKELEKIAEKYNISISSVVRILVSKNISDFKFNTREE